MPKYEIEDIEDCYTQYVLILGISEDLFWNADMSFIMSVVENKIAYDNFIQYAEYKEREKEERKR